MAVVSPPVGRGRSARARLGALVLTCTVVALAPVAPAEAGGAAHSATAPTGSDTGTAPELIGPALPTPPELAVTVAGAPQRHIVTTDDQAALDRVLALLASRGIRPLGQWTVGITGVVADLPPDAVGAVRALPGVLHVEPDTPVGLAVDQANPPWGLDRIDQRARPLDSRYSTARSGAGVTAYIIDSGLNSSHVEFAGRVRPGAYINFGDGTGTADCLGHGTHVTGTLGGTTYGVAKGVTVVPVKVFPCSANTSTGNIVSGIEWVIANHLPGVPAVANLSLGSSTVSPTLDNAVQALVDDGITVVVAAGNDNAGSCTASPARVPAAITVAASDSLDQRAAFSNFGACNDIFAPGVGVLSAGISSPTSSVTMSGTSMATPHVAGAAALVLGATPALTPAQVWQALSTTATAGVITGRGVGDPDTLLFVEPLTPLVQSLSVSFAGTGVGSVTSTPAGIDGCAASCSALFATGTTVTLSATPAPASVFEGWSGEGCSGALTCTVTMDAARSVTATFSTPLTFDLGVTFAGDGGGLVLSNPGGIDCAASCAATFPSGTAVSLTAAADVGSTFIGWSGETCSGSGTCDVTLDAARSVTATFTSNADKPLVVAIDGSGTGSVVSDPAGIDCGTVCSSTFPAGAVVTLTATPDPGSLLASWSGGGCSGAGACAVTMTAATSVTATFVPVAEPATAPSAPLAPTATLLAPLIDVGLAWSAPFDGRSAITDYVIETSADGGPWTVFADGTSAATTATVTGLTRGATYSFRVSAVNDVATGSPSPPSNEVTVPLAGFVPLAPVRLFDTRPTAPPSAIDVPRTRVSPTNILRIHVADVAGVPPTGAAAVALNVTVAEPATPGFVTVYPCDAVPTASNLNFVAGQTVPNSVIAPLSPEGDVCFFSNTATHLLADISGYFRANLGLQPVAPVRLFDTRPLYDQGRVPVTKQLYGPVPRSTTNRILEVKVTDLPGITPTADQVGAVVLNVTATETEGSGFVTVYPCGTLPTVSNLNFVARQTVPNLVIAPVSADGRICLFSNVRTHLLADISGWFAKGPGMGDIAPLRLVDTRPGYPQGAAAVTKVPVGGTTILSVQVSGLPSANVGALSLNVTATESRVPGFVTVYPCGTIPGASNVNFTAGQTVPNSVIAPVTADGRVCFYANTPVHLIVDLSGWFPA